MAVPVAVIALILASGCGGADDQETARGEGPASLLTKAEFIKQGDAICRETDKEQTSALGTYVEENPKAESTEAGQEKMVTEVGLPPILHEAEELAALSPPEGDGAKVEAIVTGIEDAVREAEQDPKSALGTSKTNPFETVSRLAAQYGFKDCKDAL